MCKIGPIVFGMQSPAPLFPRKQQHWVLAFPDTGDSDKTLVMFFRNRYLSDLGVRLGDIRITGAQTGNPSSIKGRLKKRIADHVDIKPSEWLPKNTRYISIAFDLEGAPSTIPWPWDFEDCPEELTPVGGLYAVYKAAQTIPIPKSDPVGDTVDDIIDDAGEALKQAILPIGLGIAGGVGLWLLLRK